MNKSKRAGHEYLTNIITEIEHLKLDILAVTGRNKKLKLKRGWLSLCKGNWKIGSELMIDA